MNSFNNPQRADKRESHPTCGFTLTEIIVVLAISTILMAAVMSFVVAFTRIAVKSERLENLATTARQIQEIFTQEINSAIYVYDVDANLRNRPTLHVSNEQTPPKYREIRYRAPIGPPGSLPNAVNTASTSVTFFARSELRPLVGDYFIVDTPKLGLGIRITAVIDARAANADGQVTVTLAQSLSEGTAIGYADPDITYAPANARVEIQRPRAFVVETPAPGSLTTSLRWVSNNAGAAERILTDKLSADESYLFGQVPEDPNALESAILWHLVVLDSRSTSALPGKPLFFSASSVGGATGSGSTSFIMAKSGNSLTLSNPFRAVVTSVSSNTTKASTSVPTTSATTSIPTTKATTKGTTTASTTKATTKATTTSIPTIKATTKGTTTASTIKATTMSLPTKGTTTASTIKATTTSIPTTKATTKGTTTASTIKATTTPLPTKGTTTTSSIKATTTASTTKATTTTTTTILFDG